ncbi:hypothetical protein [Rubellimicrobium rubrum]|uniref:hypothetical protein n=1 Tax=Rubellimicrobium rubrum TaxID=2585369 RepID=UPI001FEAFC9C|nr:hypothetical protein [Rubellimicrobium rubrum]
MTFATVDAPASRDLTAIVGWVLSAVFALFMLGSVAFPKLAGMAVATDTMTDLGWPDVPVFWIGVMEAGFSLVFLWRRTALLGAMLMMGPLRRRHGDPDPGGLATLLARSLLDLPWRFHVGWTLAARAAAWYPSVSARLVFRCGLA